MFILDTNVVSELRKARSGRADPKVVGWSRGVPPANLFLSTISVLELELGVVQKERADPPQGAALRAWLEQNVLPAFLGRILPVDVEVARRAARLHVPTRREERDMLIAATALVHGMTVVTRNVDDFAPTGVPLANPWEFFV